MDIPWWSILPFVLMLACIGVLPLIPVTAHYWESPRVQLAVALTLGLPVAAWLILGGEGTAVVHSLVEYGQFICLLLALFVVSGGIFLSGDIRATPRNNLLFLAFGGVIASFVGTTGAAMLLIRPLLRTNSERQHKAHTVIFLIFIVANCGGMLTPLGDPPLFMGMLRGVPFAWTFNLTFHWLFVNAGLLATYFALDRVRYGQESSANVAWDDTNVTPLGVKGKINFVFLLVIIAAVAFVPSIDLHAVESGHAAWQSFVPWREVAMLGAAAASLTLGDKVARYLDNEFRWTPILEVAAIFIGIFLTMVPALKYLAKIAPKLPLNEVTFFVFTGSLSAILDNAPTYLTFFEMARTLPGEPRIADVPEAYLVAISVGAVFGGAMTYIGNGPNFMVKAVAENGGVRMPSFGGYVVWALKYLAPTLVAMCLVFIADGWLTTVLGWALFAALQAWNIRTMVSARPQQHAALEAKRRAEADRLRTERARRSDEDAATGAE